MCGRSSHSRVARCVLAAVLALTLAAAQLTPTRAEGPGTDRLLISEMGALKGGVRGLPGAVAKKDFDAAQRHLKNINRNWPAVRSELERRGDSDAIASFESSLEPVATALETRDGESASAQATALRGALDSVSSALESPEFDGRRIVAALLLPLMLIAAIAASLPAIARKVKVRL